MSNNFGELYNDLNSLMDDHGELHTAIMFGAALFARSMIEEQRKAGKITEEMQAYMIREIELRIEQAKAQNRLNNQNNH
jgi:uncharacterized protein YaiI (UPF0178 family)